MPIRGEKEVPVLIAMLYEKVGSHWQGWQPDLIVAPECPGLLLTRRPPEQ